MNDAAEAFENILKRIHFHLIPDSSENNWCFTDYCISHTRFSMNIKDKVKKINRNILTLNLIFDILTL